MHFYLLDNKHFLFYLIGFLWTLSLHAEIVTDGSVGAAQNLLGPNFSIPETLGIRSGNNLFHSFQRFNINKGEQATFTGSAAIANVISRVTGGQISNINGLLKSTIGQADFYFLNPAGVVFGANAQIDVPSSFYLSSADELRFTDGSIYSASNPAASTLTIAQPEAFGFLGNQTGNIIIQHSNLSLSAGSTLSVSSSELQIDNTQIGINSGNIQLAAVGTNPVEVDLSGEVSNLAQGELVINNSRIDVAGSGAGSIKIRSGASEIRSSRLFADNTGIIAAGVKQGINIWADSLIVSDSLIAADTFGLGQQAPNVIVNTTNLLSVINGGVISSSTFANGNAGNITINAGQLVVDSLGNNAVTGIISQAIFSSGNAGNITVNVDDALSLNNAGFIGAGTYGIGSGNAGNIIVKAGQLVIDGQGSVFATGIFSDAASSLGQAGNITVNIIDKISIVNGGEISSSAFSLANAGLVTVNAGSLSIDSQGAMIQTGISSDAVSGSGNAGTIKVNVKDLLSITGDGSITTDTFGSSSGNAGNLLVNAGNLVLNGAGAVFFASIGSGVRTGSQGNAGTVTVNVEDTLSIEDGALIHSITNSAGNAGRVIVNAGNLNIDGKGTKKRTGIFSTSQKTHSPGNAGNVVVNVNQDLSIISGGRINTGTNSQGKAGMITITTDQLTIDGRGTKEPTGIISSATAKSAGQAGSVMLKANDIHIIEGGISTVSLPTVGTAALAKIQAAKININSTNLTLTDSFINSRSTGNVPAGSITIKVKDTLNIDPSFISTAANNANGGAI